MVKLEHDGENREITLEGSFIDIFAEGLVLIEDYFERLVFLINEVIERHDLKQEGEELINHNLKTAGFLVVSMLVSRSIGIDYSETNLGQLDEFKDEFIELFEKMRESVIVMGDEH